MFILPGLAGGRRARSLARSFVRSAAPSRSTGRGSQIGRDCTSWKVTAASTITQALQHGQEWIRSSPSPAATSTKIPLWEIDCTGWALWQSELGGPPGMCETKQAGSHCLPGWSLFCCSCLSPFSRGARNKKGLFVSVLSRAQRRSCERLPIHN